MEEAELRNSISDYLEMLNGIDGHEVSVQIVQHTDGCSRLYVDIDDTRFRVDVTECGPDEGI